jgi:hypothetical protein
MLRAAEISESGPSIGMPGCGGTTAWLAAASSGWLLALLLPGSVSAQNPAGSEFAVHAHPTSIVDSDSAVAKDQNGDFVVVWNSLVVDEESSHVFGQRFSAAGAAESRYRARFYFDPNGFDPGEGSGHLRVRPFIAFDGSGLRLVTLVLRRKDGAYGIKARVRLDDGTRADTAFFPITDEPHFLELDWQRSSGANDGQFTLQIDDTVSTQLTGLDSDSSTVESVRLGALTVKAGAAGTLFFDQFESRRERFIGPE